jgi:glycosyltransferase involved in cell wall biosynthesis
VKRRQLTVIVNWRDSDNPEAGGAERYCEEVAARLVAAGRQVVLLTSSVAGDPVTERDGYRIVRRGGRFGVYPAALAWLLLHRRRIEAVIDSQNGIPFFSPLAVGSRTPVLLLIHHVHQQQFASYFSPAMARVGRWLEGPVTRRVYRERAVVAVSPSTRRAARLQLRLTGPIMIASPGSRPPERPGRDIDERAEAPRLVCVSRMVPHKRVRLAIEAMPAILGHHPEARLDLIGDGPERAALEQLAGRVAAGRVVFHGAVPDAERDAIVRAAWIGVNPSAGEGWGISVIEANALGVPVLGFRVPGLRDSIRDGETGWLVDEGADLGPRLVDLLTDLTDWAEAERWSGLTTAWAARADWDDTARVFDAVLHSERGRLAHDDRRLRSDLATHVYLPTALVPPGWKPAFRLTDRPVLHDRGLSVVLPGTDLRDVPAALQRAGLPGAITNDPRLRVRIARPVDLIDAAVSDRMAPPSEADGTPSEADGPEVLVAGDETGLFDADVLTPFDPETRVVT